MIYVITVHHQDSRWIRPQTDYLRRHLSEPYQVFASCEGIDEEWFSSFDRVVPSLGPHAGKLNLLAAEVGNVAAPDDLLMFLDGDAFPVADPMPLVRDRLSRAPVVAIRRDEVFGQLQPHPAFCVMTLATWRELHGDWSGAHPWTDLRGTLTDTGGNLMRALERCNLPWEPLVRSNTVNMHWVWFGVYESIVYHHGAGFRQAVTIEDRRRMHARASGPWRHVPGLGRMIEKAIRDRERYKVLKAHEAMSSEIFDALVRDPDFWRRFEA